MANIHPLPNERMQKVFNMLAHGGPMDRVREAIREAEEEIQAEIDVRESWLRLLSTVRETIEDGPVPRIHPATARTLELNAATAAAQRPTRTLEIARHMVLEQGWSEVFTPAIAQGLRLRGDDGDRLETAVGNILNHAGWRRVRPGAYAPPNAESAAAAERESPAS